MAEGKMCEMLGKTLQKKVGDELINVETDKPEGLGDKEYVGLYFSAHWCPPCRGFTPRLSEFYKQFKEKVGAKKFEVVFVSSDRDESSFKEYASGMPWLYLPFADRDRKAQLSKTFKVQGIPTFVILDARSGQLITSNGRDRVGSDPVGDMFPWKPLSYKEIFNGDGVNPKNKDKFEKGEYLEKLEGKVFGIYVSAKSEHCSEFTPQLIKKYHELQGAGKPFEIVSASLCKSEEKYKEDTVDMPWPVLPFQDPRVENFVSEFDIAGCPSLVLINSDGKLITSLAKDDIINSPIEDFPYCMKPVNLVSGRYIDILNDNKCVVYFTESKEDLAKVKEVMSGPAKKFFKDGDDQEMYFFVANTSDELCGNLYNFALRSEKRRCLVTIDISEQVMQKAAADMEMTEENINEFIKNCRENKIEAKPFGQ